ncbi:DUF1003 domain-containing protein [Deinococcus pimensis]|uniref:DUF1003 domain-containing protein n=1 Tax=Deinococcus pimensis TaxID=309888 RepID=UPI0004B3F2C9|nr:DUF1003 domain-containing protein [Deinococcus pimensis]
MTQPEATELVECAACHTRRAARDLLPLAAVRPSVAAFVEADHPDVRETDRVCLSCLNRAVDAEIRDAIALDATETARLDEEVRLSLERQEAVTRNLNAEYDRALPLGDRVADRVATFGGSWRFIGLFTLVLIVWIVVNGAHLLARPFDPYPFILLNLVLSCVAALQAPVIMMSQNRLEARDRLRAEQDYEVNLKAELEVRHLHDKLDHLTRRQWQRLLVIQQAQLDLMRELSDRDR